MGMELSEALIRDNMPEYLPHSQTGVVVPRSSFNVGMVGPLSGDSPGLVRAQVSHGVRQVVLCKDGEGKIGLKVKSVNKGVFVCLVAKDSPAALGGLRFGDQILQVNGENLAGYSSDKVHGILKKVSVNNIVMAVRDRPFERALTLHKDSSGHIGFQFKDGRISSIAVDSSAARNGLLVEHNLLEVNGQNVVGVKDKEIGNIIDEGGNVITVTIIPSYIYNHIMKSMSSSLVKKMMDHSIPDV
jgi:syntenin-1